MDMKPIVDGLAKVAEVNNPITEEDYIGEDGLYYCGKCHTPKQHKLPTKFAGCITNSTVNVPCKCQREKDEALREKHKRIQFAERVKELRRNAFPYDERLKDYTFNNDDNSNLQLTNAMQKYVDNFDEFYDNGAGLLLHGKCGTGKTYAACEVANALIDEGHPVLATNFANILNKLQYPSERESYLYSLNDYRLLIIDDLGIERDTSYAKEQVYSVIDGRYRAGLPMIITTNMTIEELKNPKDIDMARIYDRILEKCLPIEVNGISHRRKAIVQNYNGMKDKLGL